MNGLKAWAVVGAIGVVLLAVIAYEMAMWQECRTQHSWFFCFHILGR